MKEKIYTIEIEDSDLIKEKGSRDNQIREISKKIFEIRKAMGFATKEQIKEGWPGEYPTVKSMIEGTKEYKEHGTGGFRYKLEKGKVIIVPDFGWIIN
jgi:hypothetical protein